MRLNLEDFEPMEGYAFVKAIPKETHTEDGIYTGDDGKIKPFYEVAKEKSLGKVGIGDLVTTQRLPDFKSFNNPIMGIINVMDIDAIIKSEKDEKKANCTGEAEPKCVFCYAKNADIEGIEGESDE